ncbi:MULTISPECIES: FAD-dependent monooxygenase [Mycobacterium avium complex (MAC)]|nr:MULTISPECIES: FAD-dependent monooxygenase [Mycobacterium avium complex (MAC)]
MDTKQKGSTRVADASVIIVGGGPVGLGAALELARFGVTSVVLEQRESMSRHPKTRNLNTRTMEIAQGWGHGVYQRLRGVDTPPGWKSPIRFTDAIVSDNEAQIATPGFEGPGPQISPASPVMSSQDLFEPILRDAAIATGLVDVRFGHQVTAIPAGSGEGDTEAAVAVRIIKAGQTYTLTGDAIVAADGADSTVRHQLGIALTGEQGLNRFVNAYFHSDIERHLADRSGVGFFIANPDAVGALMPLDAHGRWMSQIGVTPEQWSPELWDDERIRAWVRGAVGVDDLEIDVKSVGLWQINATIAERLIQGRVLLCGDAAHQFPPTGGLGLNSGLQGVHNAMWKLAFCVRGNAGWSLIKTYDDERRQPAATAIAQSLANARSIAGIAAAAYNPAGTDLTAEHIARETRRYGNHLGVELGAVYHSTAVIDDGTTPPEVNDPYSDYAPSATPGCRAPHLTLGNPTEPVSTLNLFGPSFTILAGPAGGSWRSAAADAARRLAIPVASYTVGDPGLADPTDRFTDLYGISDDGAVLVRPDGHIAWRCATGPADKNQLATALAQILDRHP